MTHTNHHAYKCSLMTIVCLLFLSSHALGATKKKSSKTVAPISINIGASVDSALIMADDYAIALTQNPRMAEVRLNSMRSYVKAKPTVVKDSICSRLYNFFVDYTSNNDENRAEAFKECFLAVASEDDPNRGPLYAAQLELARETTDTTTIKTYIPLLEDYAKRLNYDYDEELTEACKYLQKIRTRRPIREAIAGVWVSDDVAGIQMPDSLFYFNYPEKKWLINTTKVLQIRNTNSSVYKTNLKERFAYSLDPTYNASSEEPFLDIIKCRENLSALCPIASTPWYVPLYAWELPAFNMNPLSEEYVEGISKKSGEKFIGIKDHINEYLSRKVIVDEDSYSIYAFWGDEQLKRNPAEIGALLRQTTQSAQALVAGQLSRSQYDFGDRLAGNLVSGIASSALNSLVDAWMVSTEKIWSVEVTLHMVNPYKLQAILTAQLIISKSNSEKPEVYVYQHETNYYRWENKDDVFFLGCDFRDYHPWNSEWGPIMLHQMTKEDKERINKRLNSFSKDWEKRYKQRIKEWEENIKKMTKGSKEQEKAKKALKEFKETRPPQIWVDLNRQSLARLRAKSDDYELKHN